MGFLNKAFSFCLFVRNVVSLVSRTTRTYCNLKIYCADLRNGKDGRIKERIEKPPSGCMNGITNLLPGKQVCLCFYNSPYDFIMKYIFVLHNGVIKHRGL